MAESKYVVFRLGSEKYGLPIESVESILPVQPVTRLPRTPKLMLGVFEMRGATVPAIDARLRFEMDPNDDNKNFVVVLTEAGRCALSVDLVDGIVSLADECIEEKTTLFDSKEDDFVRGIGKVGQTLMVLLEPDNIVPKNLRNKVAAVAA